MKKVWFPGVIFQIHENILFQYSTFDANFKKKMTIVKSLGNLNGEPIFDSGRMVHL